MIDSLSSTAATEEHRLNSMSLEGLIALAKENGIISEEVAEIQHLRWQSNMQWGEHL